MSLRRYPNHSTYRPYNPVTKVLWSSRALINKAWIKVIENLNWTQVIEECPLSPLSLWNFRSRRRFPSSVVYDNQRNTCLGPTAWKSPLRVGSLIKHYYIYHNYIYCFYLFNDLYKYIQNIVAIWRSIWTPILFLTG